MSSVKMADQQETCRARILPSWMTIDNAENTTESNNRLQNLTFKGTIEYCNNIEDCGMACEKLMKQAENQEELVIGFDMEWPVDFRTGGGKTALIQICADEQVCYLFHVGCMNNLPTEFTQLLRHPKVKFTGVNIRNDLWKLSRDFGVIVKPIIDTKVTDLGLFANEVLKSGQTWSLDRLVLHLLKLTIDKDESVRKSNWKSQHLSEFQQMYAATDAYASFLLYNCLKERKSRA